MPAPIVVPANRFSMTISMTRPAWTQPGRCACDGATTTADAAELTYGPARRKPAGVQVMFVASCFGIGQYRRVSKQELL